MGLVRPAPERDTNPMEVLMTTATATADVTTTPTIALERIVVLGDNHRQLDHEWVETLAGSIRVAGVTDPIDVRPHSDGLVALVAGEHRLAAAKLAGLTEIPYNLQDGDGQSIRAAIENIVAKRLNPLEEARAAGNMVAEGYSHHDTAQALGWLRRKGDAMVPDTGLVTTRLRILDLPDIAHPLVASGAVPLRVVPVLANVHERARELCLHIVAALTEQQVEASALLAGDDWYGALGKVVDRYVGRTYAARFASVVRADVEALRLGKKAATSWQAAEELHNVLYKPTSSWQSTPTFAVDFAEIERDQAAVVGALLQLGGADADRPVRVILDRSLHRDLARQAIERRLEELRAEERQRAEDRIERKRLNMTPIDATVSKHRATVRDLTRQAHGTNLDLWKKLLEDLAVVTPDDMNVARFYVYGLLGSYDSRGVELLRPLAATGIRLVVEQLREETTPRRAGGTRGVPKITYSTLEEATNYLRRYVDGARSAGELFGRGLVVFAAQHYACQLVLSRHARGHEVVASFDSRAQTAFAALTRGAEPPALRQLKRAVSRALSEFEAAAGKQSRARDAAHAEAEAAKEAAAAAEDANLDKADDADQLTNDVDEVDAEVAIAA